MVNYFIFYLINLDNNSLLNDKMIKYGFQVSPSNFSFLFKIPFFITNILIKANG